MTWVKICGVTSAEDASLAADLGADAVGINLVPQSKRFVNEARAVEIARAVRGRVRTVGVVANRTAEELVTLRARLELDLLQLHGDEPPEALAHLLPHAFKAARIGDAKDVDLAARYPGNMLLVDARVRGAIGGTGMTFDWKLVATLAQRRSIVVAGGLTAENVASAVRLVQPFGVDVASGVEREENPRAKDAAKIRAFIEEARCGTR